jgi:hypothetical protein
MLVHLCGFEIFIAFIHDRKAFVCRSNNINGIEIEIELKKEEEKKDPY